MKRPLDGDGKLHSDEAAILDWGLQMAAVRVGPRLVDPMPACLPWAKIADEFYRLAESEPYLLIVGCVQTELGGQILRPQHLWDDLWLWQPPSVYPPRDPWSDVEGDFTRSPYTALVNAERAYPAHLAGCSRGAGLFLTCRVPVSEQEMGIRVDVEVVEGALGELALALACLRLTFNGAFALTSVLAIPEPFVGRGPVLRWRTGLASERLAMGGEYLGLVEEQLPEVAEWRTRIGKVQGVSVPPPAIVGADRIEGVCVVMEMPEVHAPSDALSYTFALWDLCHGGSGMETILNAWAMCETLFAGGEATSKSGEVEQEGDTRQIKRRGGAISDRKADVVRLSDLRQSFGHGRPKEGRRLDRSEAAEARGLMRDVMRAIVREASDRPDVDAVSLRTWLRSWADKIAPRP